MQKGQARSLCAAITISAQRSTETANPKRISMKTAIWFHPTSTGLAASKRTCVVAILRIRHISVTDPIAASNPKNYGADEIEIDVKRLQRDIDSGALPDTKFLTNQQVTAELQSKLDAARARYTRNPSENNSDSLINAERDLGNAKRAGECLIMGCVPTDYIKRVKKRYFLWSRKHTNC